MTDFILKKYVFHDPQGVLDDQTIYQDTLLRAIEDVDLFDESWEKLTIIAKTENETEATWDLRLNNDKKVTFQITASLPDGDDQPVTETNAEE